MYEIKKFLICALDGTFWEVIVLLAEVTFSENWCCVFEKCTHTISFTCSDTITINGSSVSNSYNYSKDIFLITDDYTDNLKLMNERYYENT